MRAASSAVAVGIRNTPATAWVCADCSGTGLTHTRGAGAEFVAEPVWSGPGSGDCRTCGGRGWRPWEDVVAGREAALS